MFFSIKSPFNLKKQGHFWKQLGILRPFFQIKSLKSEKSENYFETLCSLPFYFRHLSHNFVTSKTHSLYPLPPPAPPPSPGAMHQPWNRVCDDLAPLQLSSAETGPKSEPFSETALRRQGMKKARVRRIFSNALSLMFGVKLGGQAAVFQGIRSITSLPGACSVPP